MSDKPEMQVRLQADLGLSDDDFDYHGDDLHVRNCPGVGEWIQENHPYPSSVTTFISDPMGMWHDIPFGGKLRLDLPGTKPIAKPPSLPLL